MGIPKLQLTRYEKERAEAMSAYLGIAIQFAGKTEVIPVVQGVERLEYDITSALVKVSTEQQTVGIATAGSLTAPEGLAGLQQLLRAQHNVQVVNLVDGPVPPGVTSLIVMDDDVFTEVETYRIDQYIMSGGKVFFMAGGVGVNLGTLAAQNRDVKVGPLLRAYGIEVQNSLVVDAQAPLVGFDVGTFFPLSVRYPWFPQVVDKGFSRENPITSELQSLTLPWTSPLTLIGDTTSTGISVDVLARSSERSFASTAPFDLNPQNRISLPDAGVGPRVLAVAMVGSFTSAWKGNPQVPGDTLGVAPRPLEQSPETQIAVVGNANFLDNRFLQQFPTNSVFAANVVDWMTAGTDLIAIRSRSAMNRPLEEIEDDKKGMYKLLAMLPVPVLVILFGLVRARLGQKRRKRYPEEFGRSAA